VDRAGLDALALDADGNALVERVLELGANAAGFEGNDGGHAGIFGRLPRTFKKSRRDRVVRLSRKRERGNHRM
jgi:hypothetical protein